METAFGVVVGTVDKADRAGERAAEAFGDSASAASGKEGFYFYGKA